MWLLTLVSLPTENTALRMKTWRALKASGAAVLRDGAYLLPSSDACRDTLAGISAELKTGGGFAMTLLTREPEDTPFAPLFDRSKDYAELLAEIGAASGAPAAQSPAEAIRRARKLRKAFTALADIDFFPGESLKQTEVPSTRNPQAEVV